MHIHVCAKNMGKQLCCSCLKSTDTSRILLAIAMKTIFIYNTPNRLHRSSRVEAIVSCLRQVSIF
jgi:hypothetical protein